MEQASKVAWSEHNDMEVMAADIVNAYLHARTKEKVYIVAGSEFGPDLEGRFMLVLKLIISAARWHEELSKTLRQRQINRVSFHPSRGVCTPLEEPGIQ